MQLLRALSCVWKATPVNNFSSTPTMGQGSSTMEVMLAPALARHYNNELHRERELLQLRLLLGVVLRVVE